MNTLSISYKTAPQSVREAFSFSAEEQERFYPEAFVKLPGVSQCVILSTCNRFEIYFDGGRENIKPMEKLVCENRGISLREVLRYFNVYEDGGAVLHLTRVASGIDSMVLGEDEILRQLKEAYGRALENGATSSEFNTIFQMAIAAAKNIKTDTGLSTTPVSFGTLAANEVFHMPGEQKTVLVIGATGKIGSITAKNILSHPGINLYGTTRSMHGNVEWDVFSEGAHMVPYKDRYRYMDEADAVISATTSPHYTVTQEELEKYLKTKKPRLFIDLAVPADIDDCIADMEGITLYNIDWFRETAARNTRYKREQAQVAEERAKSYAEEIKKELTLHDLIKQLPELRSTVEKNGFDNLIYSLRNLADGEQVETVSRWLIGFLREYGE